MGRPDPSAVFSQALGQAFGAFLSGFRQAFSTAPKAIHLPTIFGPSDPPIQDLHDADQVASLYESMAVVYAGVFAIGHAVASIPLTVQKVSRGEADELPDHPLKQLLDSPSPFESGYDLREALVTFLELTGNGFWLLEGGEGFKQPTEIHILKPHRVKPIPDPDSLVKGYIHQGPKGTQTFSAPEVIHFRYFSPTRDILGMGALEPAALAAMADQAAQHFNAAFFRNGATLQGVLETDQAMHRDTAQALVDSFNRAHRGTVNAWKWRILTHGLKASTITPSHTDMDFLNLRRFSREEILMALGVPPVMVGLLDGATYANAQEQRHSFWVNTVLPKLAKLESRLNLDLCPRYGQGIKVTHDLTDVEALQESLERIVAQASILHDRGVITANQIITWLNTRKLPTLPHITSPHGDTLYVPLSLLPADSDEDEDTDPQEQGKSAPRSVSHSSRLVPVALLQQQPPQAGKNGKAPAASAVTWKDLAGRVGAAADQLDHVTVMLEKEAKAELIREAHWKAFDREVIKGARVFLARSRAYFRDLQQAVLDELPRMVDAKDGVPQARHDWQDLGGISTVPTMVPTLPRKGIDVLGTIMQQVADGNVEAFRKVYAAVIQGSGKRSLQNLESDITFNLLQPEVLAFIQQQGADLVTGVTQTVKDQLARTLGEGLANGENILDLSSRVRDVFSMSARRGQTIARTESIKAFNFGTTEGYKQSGVVQMKEWLASRDSRVRQHDADPPDEWDHAKADGQKVGLDDGFTMYHISGATEVLAFPGDPSGSAANVINCRCTVLPVLQ